MNNSVKASEYQAVGNEGARNYLKPPHHDAVPNSAAMARLGARWEVRWDADMLMSVLRRGGCLPLAAVEESDGSLEHWTLSDDAVTISCHELLTKPPHTEFAGLSVSQSHFLSSFHVSELVACSSSRRCKFSRLAWTFASQCPWTASTAVFRRWQIMFGGRRSGLAASG